MTGKQKTAASLVAVTAVLGLYYNDQIADRRSRLEACERGRQDRAVQRYGWATAEAARLAAAENDDDPAGRSANLHAAVEYRALVVDLTSRIDPPFYCKTAVPKPKFLGRQIGHDIEPYPVRAIPR